MCKVIRTFTLVALSILALLIIGALWSTLLLIPAAIVVAIYAWIWLGFRPTCFVVTPTTVEIIWPLKRRVLERATIVEARIISAGELKALVGWGLRVGAGGLWGGFGWLWTERRGIVQMYISRVDQFVWIERQPERAWLITPDNPQAFIQSLTACFRD
jgi:hypothetical protein